LRINQNFKALILKIEFALDNGYNGLSFPHYLYDDYVGDCGEGKWPLFSHAARTIKKRELTMKERELRIDRFINLFFYDNTLHFSEF
jgi:hypothetical protein